MMKTKKVLASVTLWLALGTAVVSSYLFVSATLAL